MRLHLIDGTYELFRAHYSRAPARTGPDGRDVKATVGLAGSLLRLLHDDEEAVTHVAVAFDHPIRSFRNDLFPGYKDETGVPEELLAQFSDAETAARALGLAVWPMDRYEADDALATGAARWTGDVEQVRIMTPDKDLAQCVRADRVVLVDRRNERVTDEDGVVARFGVAPASIPDWLALVGDAADGIPGIRGFGAKSASIILGRYGTIEDIPLDAGRWDVSVRGAESLAARLAANLEDALLYREVATLVTDVELGEQLDDLAWRGVPQALFEDWCASIGATNLRSRPRRWV